MHNKHDQLLEEFRKAETLDRKFFAEYRSYANLFAGNHYLASTDAYQRFKKDALRSRDKNKIRLTQNYTNLIIKSMVSSILTLSPGVKPFPNNPTETQDIKSAQLHDSIWQDYRNKTNFKAKLRRLVFDLCIFGECWVFPYWDPDRGTYLGDEQVTDELTGEVVETRARFSGEVELKRVLPYDVRRDPGAKSLEDAKWIGFVELKDRKELEASLPEELHKYIETSDKSGSYITFNYNNGEYSDEKDKVELRHMFYRPSPERPKGAYAVFTDAGKLYEDEELPLGIFPMLWCGFDELPGSPRCVSGLRQGKPYQQMINFLASQKMKTMLTLGDDKLIIQAGSTISAGEELPGIRAIKVNGPEPTILGGRSGEQFTPDLESYIQKYFEVMGVSELKEKKEAGQFDPYAMLFRSARDKARFSIYASKVEEFVKQICEVVLRLKKAYMDDEEFIRVVGASERVNIPEFKNMDDLSYQIRLEEVGDDADTKVGKQMALNTILQYAGPQLTEDQLGLFIREMPYLNGEKIFEKVAQPYDRATNVILALDRGETWTASENDPHVDYIIDAIYTRMSKADFKYLDPQTQGNYQQALEAYEQIKAAQLQKQQQLEQGFIPADGPTVPIDGVYTETIGSNGQPKAERVRLPLSALQWLQQTLQNRGQLFNEVENMPQSLKAQLAQQLAVQNEQESMAPQAIPMQQPMGM